jgi:hypothetical protein
MGLCSPCDGVPLKFKKKKRAGLQFTSTDCTVCSPHILQVVPYPSLDIYFSDDKLKKEPGIWLLELISTQLDPDPHFFMRIWIQEANLLKIRADPDLKHCFKVTLSQNCFYVKKNTTKAHKIHA